jgi:hypothetical protein
MPTVQNGTAYSTPVSLGGSIPGDAATGHPQRDVAAFVENLFPMEWPILTRVLKAGKNRRPTRLKANQHKAEWGTGGNLPRVATVEGVHTAGAATLTVESGQGVRFQVGHRFAAYNLDATSGEPDQATKEEFRVTDRSGDVLTVTGAQAGTSATEFADGAHIEILSTAVLEDGDFTLAPNVFGDFYYNYYQLRGKKARVTMAANVTPNWEYDERELARRMTENTRMLKEEFEAELLQAGRQVGSATVPFLMGGIPSFVLAANTYDAADAKIGPYDIEVAGAALWESVGSKAAKTLLMSMTTARFFDGLMNRYKQSGMNDTSVNLTLMEFTTRTGTYKIEPTRHMLPGRVLGVDFDNLYVIPYEGMEWQEKDHATDGAYFERSIFGQHTLICEAPETMFLVEGFNMDLAAYGRIF